MKTTPSNRLDALEAPEKRPSPEFKRVTPYVITAGLHDQRAAQVDQIRLISELNDDDRRQMETSYADQLAERGGGDLNELHTRILYHSGRERTSRATLDDVGSVHGLVQMDESRFIIAGHVEETSSLSGKAAQRDAKHGRPWQSQAEFKQRADLEGARLSPVKSTREHRALQDAVAAAKSRRGLIRLES